MVKSLLYTLAAAIICAGLFIFTEFYVLKQFEDFSSAVNELYLKVENKTANREDGFAVKTLWNDRKKKLQVFLPHNDISYMDYWLGEACGLIYEEKYDLALGKIEVLKEISAALPDAYSVRLENIF